MSIAGYFSKRGYTDLRMPKARESPKASEPNDALAIRYEGAVLTGQESVEQAQRDDAIRVVERPGVLQHIYAPR